MGDGMMELVRALERDIEKRGGYPWEGETMTAVQRLDARIRGLGRAIREVGGRLAEDEEIHYMTPNERALNEKELDELVRMRDELCLERRRVIERR